jgi:DNA adenine methylase
METEKAHTTKSCNGVERVQSRSTHATPSWPPLWLSDPPPIADGSAEAARAGPAEAAAAPRDDQARPARAAEPAPDPYPWRRVLPRWPIPWRERWGRRANELAESGIRWPDDERQAFAEILAERERYPMPPAGAESAKHPTPPSDRPARPREEQGRLPLGPAVGDTPPAIVIDEPDHGRMPEALTDASRLNYNDGAAQAKATEVDEDRGPDRLDQDYRPGAGLDRPRRRTRTAAPKKFRPLVKTHGGKYYTARRIINCFPSHRIYVEPFAGGLNVLLNKPPAVVEVASDLDGDLINLYQMIQARCGELTGALGALPYNPTTFDAALSWLASDDPLWHAVGYLVRKRFSRGGLGETFAWSERLRGGRPGDENAWLTIQAELPRVADRLRGVDIRQAPAIEVVREHDGPDALHYCDPPYLHSTRTARDAYRFEMTAADHAELLDVLMDCRGTVVLSGYPSPLYDARLAGWRRITFDMANHAGQGRSKQRREEVIWIKR